MAAVGLSIQKAMTIARQRVEAGMLREAEEIYRQVVGHRADQAQAWHELGDVLVMDGRPEEAVECYRRAIAVDGTMAVAWSNLGVALDGLGRTDEAIAGCQRAVELDGGFVDAWHNLGIALGKRKRFAEAAEAQGQAVELRPVHARAHFEMGVALQELRQYERAMECYRRSMALDARDAKPPHSMGVACYELGRYAEALVWFDRAIALDGEFAEAHWHRAVVRLLLGEFEEGWRGYEWRWRCREIAATRRQFTQPAWTGQDLSGQTILLYAEQGFGDAIQFARYAAMAAQRQARVIVECHAELVTLLSGVAGVSEVVARGGRLPAFDLHASLLDMPLRFGTTLQTVPASVPYLSAPTGKADFWQTRLGPRDARARIGLVWAGSAVHSNDVNRSLELGQFGEALAVLRDPSQQIAAKEHKERREESSLCSMRSLAAISAHFYSLQKGPAAAQASRPPVGMELVDLGAELDDFADTAGAISQLDLVITVDTAVAHLAGAMGKEVWVLLPFVPDFRWMIGRSDSPWYPTMRLFRQKALGDWAGALEEVGAALAMKLGVR